jgi:LysR family transcriptional regulator for bpeEF and oprC
MTALPKGRLESELNVIGNPFCQRDLVQDGVDVALRVGELGSSGLIARKIGEMQMITVASPGYLAAHGVPAKPQDLAHHKLIAAQTGRRVVEWRLSGTEGTIAITPTSIFRSNEGEDLRAAVLAGMGILHGPSALFHADIEAGRIVKVLEGYTTDADPIHLVTSSGRKMAHRVRVVIDFLAATFASEPALRIT